MGNALGEVRAELFSAAIPALWAASVLSCGAVTTFCRSFEDAVSLPVHDFIARRPPTSTIPSRLEAMRIPLRIGPLSPSECRFAECVVPLIRGVPRFLYVLLLGN